jgi:hypothetical protein
MPVPELVLDTTSIVIKGQIDPAELAADHLLAQGLIASTDYSDAQQRFSSLDTAILQTSWFSLAANREIIQIQTNQPEDMERVRDLIVGVLKAAKNTQAAVLGLNKDVHFKASTKELWHAVGDAFTPKQIWKGVLTLPGMASAIIQAVRPDLYIGYEQVTIQPSGAVPLGVFVSHNDHYTLELQDSIPTSREYVADIVRSKLQPSFDKNQVAVSVLNDEWQLSMKRAQAVLMRVAEQAQE